MKLPTIPMAQTYMQIMRPTRFNGKVIIAIIVSQWKLITSINSTNLFHFYNSFLLWFSWLSRNLKVLFIDVPYALHSFQNINFIYKLAVRYMSKKFRKQILSHQVIIYILKTTVF